ncbi:hypothetical protein PIB30_034251 [Stylosanthes scabra]|uniref:Uncharacterized protein n=1 Tax=Stylosanthes scabra TaxID=79078 RepID=A0ABU6VEQ8_9FABA|nr:hypothetical protein [Stylosanthes scabra]
MADKILSSSKDETSSTKKPSSSRRPTPHYSPRRMPVAQREGSTSSVKGTRSFCYERDWRDGTSVKNEVSSEEDPGEEDEDPEEEEPEQEDNPEDGIPDTPFLPMDIEAEEDYQCYIEELGRVLEHSPVRSSQASVPDIPVE